MSPYERHEIERTDGGRQITERRSYVPAIASTSAALMFGAVAFWMGAGGGSDVPGGPPTLPTQAIGPPNAPVLTAVTPIIDSVTFRLDMTTFAGSGGDTHDSTRIMVDSAGGDFTAPLLDTITGPVTVDSVAHGFAHTGVYDFVALHKGTTGGWSDTSGVVQRTVLFTPAPITDLSVVSATTSSLTLQWTTVHNGQGGKANHGTRYKNITGDTASFIWWETQEGASEQFDSLGSAIGEVVQKEITGLIAGDTYEFGVITYAGEPGVDVTWGPLPTPETRAVGTTQAGGGGGPVAPSTPTLSLGATSDTSAIQMTSSGFDGQNQTHDSTEWRLDDNSDMSSPFHVTSSTVDKTSHLVTDNANLTGDVTYYGDVRYFASATGWTSRSAIKSVVNTAPPPPGSGDHPNEPSGMTLYREWLGQSLTVTGQWGEADTGPAKHSIVTEGGLPSGNPALYRKTYPAGMTLDGAGTEFLFTAGDWMWEERSYVSMWIRPDSDWVGHPAGANKVFYIEVNKAGGGKDFNFFFLMTGSGSGTLKAAVELQNMFWCPGSSARFTSNATIPRGVWTQVEVLLTMNTPGNADGKVQTWINGNLVINEDGATNGVCNMEISQHSDPRVVGMQMNSIYGGRAEGTLAETQILDADNMYMSGGPR